ncbi:hypothetical protein EWM64_g10491 [Hericium alpestre]|uniref:Velvet domain-containing protein n=1 Tax=Hericium alpestre TaxID=135208 RepID=A0A4Y9ZI80_9AGAM|nr:hypothetical protein EWM64_g10491 [Hericium alpestre]
MLLSAMDGREYELMVRQQPKQARMCGVGADRRPIDPPPIVQLRVLDHSNPSSARRSHAQTHSHHHAASSQSPSPPPHHHPRHQSPLSMDMLTPAPNSTLGLSGMGPGANGGVGAPGTAGYLQNPYYFMFASLAKPDDDVELHWMKDGKTRCTTGSVVSSLYHLKDSENDNTDAGFFVFPDLSVRQEGSYRLKLSLFEVVGSNVYHCKSIYSAPFYVYTAKKFPGMEESTPLSCSLADQGIKIRIRKDIRQRKARGPGPPFPGLGGPGAGMIPQPVPIPTPVPIPEHEQPLPLAPGGGHTIPAPATSIGPVRPR